MEYSFARQPNAAGYLHTYDPLMSDSTPLKLLIRKIKILLPVIQGEIMFACADVIAINDLFKRPLAGIFSHPNEVKERTAIPAEYFAPLIRLCCNCSLNQARLMSVLVVSPISIKAIISYFALCSLFKTYY